MLVCDDEDCYHIGMNMRVRSWLVPVLLLLGTVSLSAQIGSGPMGGNVRVSVVSEFTRVQPGDTFFAALRQRIRPDWHTYWQNPGDSGQATRMQWQLPEGFSVGAFEWPAPETFFFEGLASYGYSTEVYLPFEIHVDRDV